MSDSAQNPPPATAIPQRLAYWGGPLDGEHTKFRMREGWPLELYTPAHGVTIHPDVGSTHPGRHSHRYELTIDDTRIRYVYRGVVRT